MLEKIVASTGDAPKIVIIWLHGLGADGNDFEPVVPQLNITGFPIRFVFPHAPIMPITINGGMTMRAWYDIKSMDINKRADVQGVLHSEKLVHSLIEEQMNQGYKPDQIVLAGFSQGGAMSLHSGLRYHETLAGIIALSCYIPLSDKLPTFEESNNKSTPIFLAHGSYDPVVPYELGQAANTRLKNEGYSVKWQDYPLQHGVNMDEIQDIKSWIIKNLKK